MVLPTGRNSGKLCNSYFFFSHEKASANTTLRFSIENARAGSVRLYFLHLLNLFSSKPKGCVFVSDLSPYFTIGRSAPANLSGKFQSSETEWAYLWRLSSSFSTDHFPPKPVSCLQPWAWAEQAGSQSTSHVKPKQCTVNRAWGEWAGLKILCHIQPASRLPSSLSPALLATPQERLHRSRLRICFRGKSNGEFKCSCLPSCSMIYLKHPSFGIQHRHLTAKERKKLQNVGATEIRNTGRAWEEPCSSPSCFVFFF